jgi:hypothetical protein
VCEADKYYVQHVRVPEPYFELWTRIKVYISLDGLLFGTMFILAATLKTRVEESLQKSQSVPNANIDIWPNRFGHHDRNQGWAYFKVPSCGEI